MNRLELQFQYAIQPVRPACALFVPSDAPACWIEELQNWNCSLQRARFYPLPRSRRDNTTIGVLILVAIDDEPRLQRSLSQARSSVLMYGRVARQLYAPTNCHTAPRLTEAAWVNLLDGPSERVHVWHPACGLVSFDATESFHVASLINLPKFQEMPADKWGGARSGTAFPTRIESVRAGWPTSIEVMLQQGREEIGSRPIEEVAPQNPVMKGLRPILATILGPISWLSQRLLNQLNSWQRPQPISPSPVGNSPETSASVGLIPLILVALIVFILVAWLLAACFSIWQRPLDPGSYYSLLFFLLLVWPLLNLLSKSLSQNARSRAPSTPAHTPSSGVATTTGPGTGVGQWLQSVLQGIVTHSQELMNARQHEINRLIDMLEKDPDEGLKFALPLTGDAARGIAPAGTQLQQRQVDFGQSMGGSGPADVWGIDGQYQLKLLQKYRELAGREVQLGRHRRAAYIYSQLLGDHATAAATLVHGRYYREAAALYAEKLDRKLDAAKCLADGGLPLEAIPLYRELGHHESVGDLYRQLEDHRKADAAYQLAVDKELTLKNYVGASQILIKKVDAPDDALELLDQGFTQSTQSHQCLEATFMLLTDLKRTEEIGDRFKSLRSKAIASGREEIIADVVSTYFQRAPEPELKKAAADTVRTMAAQVFEKGDRVNPTILRTLERLAPHDKQLTKDCQRVLNQAPWSKHAAPPKPSPVARSKSAQKMELVRSVFLSRGLVWKQACASGRELFVLGLNDDQACAATMNWTPDDSNFHTVTWELPVGSPADAPICMAYLTNDRQLVIGSRSQKRLALRPFSNDQVDSEIVTVGTPHWMPASVSALAVTPSGMQYVYEPNFGGALSCLNERHETITQNTLIVPEELSGLISDHNVHMVASDSAVFVAVSQLVYEIRGKAVDTFDLHQPVTGLVLSLHKSRPTCLALFEAGAAVLKEGGQGCEQHIAQDVVRPHAVFLRDGRLVIHGRNTWQIYSTENGALRLQKEFHCELETDVFGLVRSGVPNQVALCTSDGLIRCYRIP